MPSVGHARAGGQSFEVFVQRASQSLLPIIDRITALYQQATNPITGRVPEDRKVRLQIEAGEALQRWYVGGDFRSVYSPSGEPLSAFAAILEVSVADVIARVTAAHATYMRQRLPQDVQTWLMTAPMPVGEADDFLPIPIPRRIFDPNPLAHVDGLRTWVDPRGYRLSDRIWRASLQARQRIDALLEEAVTTGRDAVALSADLEEFLLPERLAYRTSAPYGKYAPNVSMDAMRLARTEIARAHSYAALINSKQNPFTSHMDWALSAQHPRVDICDGIASIGMDGARIRNPYPIDDCPVPIEASHPNCLCVLVPVQTEDTNDIVNELRRMVWAGEPPPITPLNEDIFVQFVTGNFVSLISKIGGMLWRSLVS